MIMTFQFKDKWNNCFWTSIILSAKYKQRLSSSIEACNDKLLIDEWQTNWATSIEIKKKLWINTAINFFNEFWIYGSQ